jgi:hypothetical protein
MFTKLINPIHFEYLFEGLTCGLFLNYFAGFIFWLILPLVIIGSTGKNADE